ncbi:MAG: DUF2723 domain-containing protein [Balneolaceae bacterium]|nr:DUF2723 domain-containing protein [Balneolaceae bacterium]
MTVAPTTSFWDPAEYIAIAHTLQVAHPPGSPFFALVGRIVSMFVPAEYVAFSINMISVVASAFTIMLLYLIIVRLIEEWRGPAEEMDFMDLAGMYGGALLGAFTFTVTHTQWFNAVEAEMYASSMFLTALVVWVSLKWSANHDQPYSERWLVLIAYLFGIGIGVHLLNLLALFFVAMIIYYKKIKLSLSSFLVMGGIAIFGFLSVYPGIVIWIPEIAGQIGSVTYGLIGPVTFVVLVVAALAYGIYYTHHKKYRIANLVLLAYAMIMIGYSSYSLVIIRSQAAPPIDENDPSTAQAFVSYLSRDQYGQSPLLMGNTYDNSLGTIDREEEVLFPRRHSAQPQHLQYYSNFDSDLDFFLSYQVNHMYIRYFNWNFIGREADIQDTGWYSGFSETRHSNNPANSGYFYLPLLLGLFGFLYHFRNDWKRAFAILALFLLTGLAIIFYLNQTPYEPRERDYAYVGSFFAFTIWVGLGATGIIEMIKDAVGKSKPVAFATLGVLFLAVPGLMAVENWPSHDRSELYVARDYAYNLLQSLEENAIVFTNGDNDTFPLWYLQEVEGIRTDVRVVNLSLLNTDWYIKQLRDRKTHESLPLPIDMTDEEIEQMTSQLELFEPQEIVIPVDKDLLSSVFEASPDQLEDSTSQFFRGGGLPEDVELTPMLYDQLRMAEDYSIPVEEMDDEVSWYLQGRSAGRDSQGNERFYLQTQDRMILHILRNNKWLRPVYFANTVSNSGQLGLQNYFQFEGKSFRVVPKRREVGPFGYVDPEVHADRLEKFRFENWDSPDVYFNENIRRMLGNYRYGFTQLADAFMERGDTTSAAHWLVYGEENIPFREIEHDWTVPTLYAYRYMITGETERANDLALFISEQLKRELQYDMQDLDEIESQLASLEEDVQMARSRARTDEAQQLRNRMQRLASRRETIVQNISFSVSRLTILQNVFYENDKQEAADLLRMEVNAITNGRLALPDSIEESRQRINQFGLNQ